MVNIYTGHTYTDKHTQRYIITQWLPIRCTKVIEFGSCLLEEPTVSIALQERSNISHVFRHLQV